MSGGLNDGNWSMKVKEQRGKIRELEKRFLEKPSKKKALKIVEELYDYLSMKKGYDD